MGFVVETRLCRFESGPRLWGFLVFEVERVRYVMSVDVIFRVKNRDYRLSL